MDDRVQPTIGIFLLRRLPQVFTLLLTIIVNLRSPFTMFKFNFDIEEADTEALNNLSLDEKPNADQKDQPASPEQAALAAYKSHTVAELVNISFYST